MIFLIVVCNGSAADFPGVQTREIHKKDIFRDKMYRDK